MAVKGNSGLNEPNEERKREIKREGAIRKFEDTIRHNDYETLGVYDRDGNPVAMDNDGNNTIGGSESEVRPSLEQLNKMKGHYVTHNHPKNSPPSYDDVQVMVVLNLPQLRATSRKWLYTLTVSKTIRDKDGRHTNYNQAVKFIQASKEAHRSTFFAAEEEAHQKGIRFIDVGNRTTPEGKAIWDEHYSNWFKNNASKYGYEYSRKRLK